MVFPGHFSTGCSRCRRRKVKCDERKPSCRRCYIYGEPCPGYSDQFQFRYRKNGKQKATPNSEGNAAAKAGPSNTSDSDSQSSSSSTQCTKFINQTPPRQPQRQRNANATQSSVPAVLPPSIEHMSLCYFVRRFVSPGCSDSYPGHLTFLPNLLDTDNYGLLELATLSVAQIAAFNQYGGSQLLRNAYNNHGRAIRCLRDCISSDTLATDDKTTAAVLMLCAFIDVSGENSGDPRSHASGLYYLLEKRGPEQFATKRGFELYVLGLIRLQAYSFIHSDNTYTNPCSLGELFGLFDPLMRAMNMVSRTLELRQTLLSGVRTAYESPQSPYSQPMTADGDAEFDGAENIKTDEALVLQQCFEALEEFDQWDSEAASYWHTTFEDRTEPTRLGDAANGARHYDQETACTIILVRSSRLILLDSLLRYHQNKRQLDPHSDTTRLFAEIVLPTIIQNVRNTIDDMLSCVPYALGDLDHNGTPKKVEHDAAGGLIILQPMRLVTFCPYSTPEQMTACKEVLKRINMSMGVRSAISWSGFPGHDRLMMPPTSEQAPGLQGLADSGSPSPPPHYEQQMFDVA